MGLSMIDYAVWWQLMALSLGIGIYIKVNYKRRGNIILDPVDDFYLAGRQLGILPVSLSAFTSFVTAITIMGGPTTFFKYGINFLMNAGSILWTIIPCAFLFAPLYEKLPIITVYEYIGWRFNKSVKMVGVVMYVVRMQFYLSNALVTPAITFKDILDGNHWFLMVVTVTLAVVFTALGGMRAVVWSNVFQVFLTLTVPIMISVTVISSNNTLTDIYHASYYTNRFKIIIGFDWDERNSVLSSLIAYGFMVFGVYGTNQVIVQQMISLKDKKNIKIALIIAMMGFFLVYILTFLISVIIAFDFMACDPVKSRELQSYNHLLSKYVSKTFLKYTGLAGAVIAGLFGTGLSTVASAVLSMATVTLNDIILIYRKDLSPGQKVILIQLFILLYGALVFGIAIILANSALIKFNIANLSAMCGAQLTLLIMAWCLPFVNSYGALAGFVVTDVLVYFLHFLRYISKFSYRLRHSTAGDCKITDAWLANQTDTPADNSGFYILLRIMSDWEQVIAMIVGISFGCIVSAYTNKRVDIRDRKVDSRLISPLVHKCFKSYLKFSENSYVRPEELEKKPDTTKSKRRKSYKPETKEEIIH